jgi:rhodanese-related sulfurtransferase
MEIKHATPAEASAALSADPNAVYLDVRTEGEFELGHPAGAVNVPIVFLDGGGGPARPNERFLDVVRRHIEASKNVFVGCQSGVRSARAAEILSRAGYASVTNVTGGFGGQRDRSGNVAVAGWRDSGLAVETGTPSGRSYKDLARD